MSSKDTSRHGRYLPKLVSPNPDVNEDRKSGLELINLLDREPYIATQEDIKWFWKDQGLYNFDINEESDLYQNAKEYVERNLEELGTRFPYELTEWLLNWYSYMPDAFYYRKDRVGQIDWNILFTLIGRNPPIDSSTFHLVIKALNVRQGRTFRERIYREIANSPDLSQKVLSYKPIPLAYTQYTPYSKIRKEVLKILKPPREAAPRGSRGTFREVEKLMREGLDFETALKQVEKQNEEE